MQMIYLVTVISKFGTEQFWAGADNETEALLMAAKQDHTGDGVSARQVVNEIGVQKGEWKSAI